MKRSHWPWTGRSYVCIPVTCLSRCNLRLVQCDIIIWSFFAVKIYYNGDGVWSVYVYLGCIYGRISLALDDQNVRANYSMLDFGRVIGVWFNGITLIFCQNTRMVMIGVRLSWLNRWNDLAGCWMWTNRKYVCIPVCLTLNLFLEFDPVWDHVLTLISYHDILRWRWLVCDYHGRINGNFSLTVDDQMVRLYFCVWLWCRHSRSIEYTVIISY